MCDFQARRGSPVPALAEIEEADDVIEAIQVWPAS